MKKYRTLKEYAEIEMLERKSRFIGIASPLTSPDQAQDLLDQIRARFPDATHHVSAWKLSLNGFYQRYSDDGEPKGTAGMPVLDVIEKQDLTECGIIVVRYFGGIKLGAGGLVRAYSAAAVQAVKAAGIISYEQRSRFRLIAPYNLAETIIYQLGQRRCAQAEPAYGVNVEWVIAPLPGDEEPCLSLVKELSSDTVLIEPLTAEFMLV